VSARRFAGGALLLAVLGLGWLALRPSPPPLGMPARGAASAPSAARSPRAPRVAHPPSDEADEPEADEATTEEQAMAAQAEANQRSVREASETGRHPERLSEKVAPAPFDPAAWKADPRAYLDVVEPGRVFQTAAPGQGVPALKPASDVFVALHGGAGLLSVFGAPDAPVTFTSPDGGTFDNGLSSITVRANAEGYAQVRYRGTVNRERPARILAGSPMATDNVTFQIGPREP